MTDEKYFSLNPDNFHEVSDSGKGFFNGLKDANRQFEYEKSNFNVVLDGGDVRRKCIGTGQAFRD